MTDATATFHDVILFCGRVFALAECRRAVRVIAHGALIGLGGVAAACVLVTTVTVAAAWIAGIALRTNPYLQAKATIGPAAISLANHYPALAGTTHFAGPPRGSTDPADALTFEVKWARAMALASMSSGAEAVARQLPDQRLSNESSPPPALELPPAHVKPEVAHASDSTDVAELPSAAAPDSAPSLTPSPKLDPDLANSTPPPRPRPVKSVVAAFPAGQIASHVAPQVAAATPPPLPPSEKRVAPRQAHNRSMPLPGADSRTAVYDITGRTVYLPNGDRLEAHSGLGEKLDDPRYVSVKNRGPTPPNVYALALREQLFHGVQAIRLNPIDEGKMFGRDGMLAHTYMLGPNGQSNGCVSFKDYPKFLRAVISGEVDRLVVVADLGNTSWRTAAARSGYSRRYADKDL